MRLPGVLVELVDLDPEGGRDAWAQWYDAAVLVPRARLDGVIAARRGVRATGSVQNLVVYDLADVTAPLAWPEPPAAPVPVARHEALLYRQILSTVEGPYRPPGAEVLHGAFFAADPADHDEFNAWYDTEHVLFVDVIDGYLNCRRFQSLADPSQFLALYDVTTLDAATSEEVARANQSPWSDRIRAKVATYRERRLFTIAREETS